jgi:hypothetical protein
MGAVHRLEPRHWRGARPLSSAIVARHVREALQAAADAGNVQEHDEIIISGGGGGGGWWQSALEGEGYEEGDRPSMASDDREWTEGEIYALIATVRDILAAAPAPNPAAAGRSTPPWPDVMAFPSEAAATDGPTPAMARPAVPPPPGAPPAPSPMPLAGHQGGGHHGGGQVTAPNGAAAAAVGSGWDPTYRESTSPPPPRSPAEFDAAWHRLVGRGGWSALCWALNRRLEQLDDPAHDEVRRCRLTL